MNVVPELNNLPRESAVEETEGFVPQKPAVQVAGRRLSNKAAVALAIGLVAVGSIATAGVQYASSGANAAALRATKSVLQSQAVRLGASVPAHGNHSGVHCDWTMGCNSYWMNAGDGCDCTASGMACPDADCGIAGDMSHATVTDPYSDGCSPGCYDGWEGDGICDADCMVAACNFDGGDCDNTPPPTYYMPPMPEPGTAGTGGTCSPGCYDGWEGDGVCDADCMVAACNFDGGDCDNPPSYMPPMPEPDTSGPCGCYMDDPNTAFFCTGPDGTMNTPTVVQDGTSVECHCQGTDFSANPPLPMTNELGPVCTPPSSTFMPPMPEPDYYGATAGYMPPMPEPDYYGATAGYMPPMPEPDYYGATAGYMPPMPEPDYYGATTGYMPPMPEPDYYGATTGFMPNDFNGTGF